MADGRPPSKTPPVERKTTAKLVVVLVFAGTVGGLAAIPYRLTLAGHSMESLGPQLPVVLASQAVVSLVFTAITAGLGLWLGAKVGLGAPLLRGLLAGRAEARRRIRSMLLPAGVAGLAVGAFIVAVLSLALPAEVTGAGADPPPWQGLLASLHGGIGEEIHFRLGGMTLLVWLGVKVTRAPPPSAALIWSANAMVALLFGLGHLPTAAQALGLTPAIVVATVVTNGVGAMVFGWFYWRRGLLAAMLAHFSTDLVLHVFVPLLSA